MAGSTEFLPFATGGSANVEDQATWAADAAVPNGFSSGIASSAKFNKALRQGTFFAAAISQWIADQLSTTVHDDGSVPTLEGQFGAALASFVATGATSTSDITAAGSGNVTVPSWAGHAEVEIVGAGGGGQGGASGFSGGGGGAGGYAKGVIAVTPSATIAYTVGAGGTGGAAGQPGANGATTTLTGIGSATGGQGAGSLSPPGSAGGGGGAGSGSGLRLFHGGYGGDGNVAVNTVGGNGAAGPYGGAGRAGAGGGLAGVAPGSGGGGSESGASAGGNGADGAILIRWML
jgi:hypothetical protein